MKTHITTLNNMAGTASLAHRRVLKVAQSIGCHEMGLSFYPLKPDYAKEIDKRLDGIIAPLNYGDIVIFQYPSWIGVNYDESFVNKIKSYRDTKLIIFVQDIQKLMFDSEQAILDMEIKTLNKADLLILPSKKMHRYLKENGLDEKPVIYQTNVKMSVLDSLFEKCDFYLDINHEGEIVDAVHRAFLNNMLIVGYEETMHNAYYTADTNTFKESEYANMAEALNLTLAMPHLIDEALAMQKKAAVAADATDYMEILHL